MRADERGEPGHRVLVEPDEAGGLADAAPLGQVPQDGQDLLVGEPGVEEGVPLNSEKR